ncbi:glyoxalase family protein [Apiospora phragmitis]|uniref:Glyoxalase family protein n=1 Tax=Apiospora phragmitis TaxID=2905665 RepID=A0ABR1X5Y0_9PEZI
MAAEAPRKIILNRISHAYYKYQDMEKAIYFRGYGTAPWVVCAVKADRDEFAGVGYVVESEDELRYAAETLPKATKVYELEDAPGKGKCVTFYDPVDNFPFHLVYGQEEAGVLEVPLPQEPINYPFEKNRPKNHFQRFQKRPAPVHKLGHWGHCSTNYAKAYEFYTTHFNLIASDLVHDDAGTDITCFLRLDRGKEPVDHHCFFFYQGPKFHVHHTSYETHDFDTQVLGHDWLREKGYKNCWGVGRHVLGSQIFDYWFDPTGNIMEHYVDGDLVDDTQPPHRSKASPDSLHVWGKSIPPKTLPFMILAADQMKFRTRRS